MVEWELYSREENSIYTNRGKIWVVNKLLMVKVES